LLVLFRLRFQIKINAVSTRKQLARLPIFPGYFDGWRLIDQFAAVIRERSNNDPLTYESDAHDESRAFVPSRRRPGTWSEAGSF
jgi:hypothetical protein